MMAIGAKNLLKTISKQRQVEQKDLQVSKIRVVGSYIVY